MAKIIKIKKIDKKIDYYNSYRHNNITIIIMPVTFRIIGIVKDNKNIEFTIPISGHINLPLIHGVFHHYGIDPENLSDLRFVIGNTSQPHENKELNDMLIHFEVPHDKTILIYVFTNDITLRSKLVDIFLKQNNSSESIQSELNSSESNQSESIQSAPINIEKPINVSIPEVPKMTDEIIQKMNIAVIKKFEDPDFKTLVNIFMRKPTLFSDLAKYTQNGNIIEENMPDNKDQDYSKLVETLDMLLPNNQFPYDLKLHKLQKYSGHINLTLRDLLTM